MLLNLQNERIKENKIVLEKIKIKINNERIKGSNNILL